MPQWEHGKVNGHLEILRWQYENGRALPAEYQLTGGPIVYIRRNLLADEHPTRVFSAGPHLFYPLGVDYARDTIIAAHINGPFWWLALLPYYGQFIEQRVLVTLYVWGLADYQLNQARMTWDDVHLVQWMKRRVAHE